MYECSAAFTIQSVSLTLITPFSRYLEENSSVTTYLGKLIIHIVLLQPPNTMYLPAIEVSDDIVSLCGDEPAWKSPDAANSFNTNGPPRYSYVLLLESSKLAIQLLIAMEHRFFTNCFMNPHVIRRALIHLRRCFDFDTIGSARCTTVLGQLLQTHYNRFQ